MANTTGGCLCGQVRYTLTGNPEMSGLCHCRDCQRYTGSAFEPLLIFEANSIDLRGELKTFDVKGGSGNSVHRRFCPNCGSGVVNELDSLPGKIIVLAGSLDDPSLFVPQIEVFCEATQPWLQMGGERKRFPGMPG